MPKRLLIFLCVLASAKASAQTGSQGVFRILDIPMHSKSLAWCGYLISQPSSDILQTTNNPALLSDEHRFKAGLSAGTILPGVFTANAAFGIGNVTLSGRKISLHGFAQRIDYGSMDGYDAGGNPTLKLVANETNIGMGGSMALSPQLRFGAQLGMVYSILGPFISSGVYVNLGLNHIKKDSTLSAGLLIKNLGAQVMSYQDAGREPLPFNVQAAVAIMPKHMPFKFHLVAHSLQKWDLTYNQYLNSNGQIDINGQMLVPQEAKFAEKLGRHLAVGTELALGKNFGIYVGYSQQRRKEMITDVRRGTAGFGWGLKFKMAKLDITYSSASYFSGQNSNMFSIIIDPNRFSKKRTVAFVQLNHTPCGGIPEL
ncbi:hypothetical protein LBMAG26_03630 [Bacteroidota bacterium]|nr:hypothetical protein LBMAG26_03630 [Bacteroidota bacterium]